MSLTSLFSTAQRSLMTAQAQIGATAQNVANAETPGYTRRVVRSQLGQSAHFPSEVEFLRMRSGVLDRAVRDGRAGQGGAGESAGLLAGLEAQLAADGGDAFLGAVGDFFRAWSSVGDHPTDLGARDALIGSADHLARTLRSADERLAAFGASVRDDLRASVGDVNDALAEVAALNLTIRAARAGGADDNDALDRRDALLDGLAGLAPFETRLQADGTATVTIDGMVAVQDGEARPLRLGAEPGSDVPALYADGDRRPLRLDALSDGVLGAQIHLLGTTIPDARAGLDALAAEVVTTVNAAHADGTGLDGQTGRPFFDPAGTTAASIATASGLTAQAVAAGAQPGDASVATHIAALADSLGGRATELLSGVGAQARRARSSAEAAAAFAAHAETLRDGVSRVSLDEEMANLIRYQQTYAASARVLETADSLFDTLLAL